MASLGRSSELDEPEIEVEEEPQAALDPPYPLYEPSLEHLLHQLIWKLSWLYGRRGQSALL